MMDKKKRIRDEVSPRTKKSAHIPPFGGIDDGVSDDDAQKSRV